MKEAWLNCTITPGQFSCEYAVEGVTHTGEGFSLFACDYDLEFRCAPAGAERINGFVRVEVIDEQGNLALIRLPQRTMENGETVTVNRRDLRYTPCAEPAR
jgi:hypothetical protein